MGAVLQVATPEGRSGRLLSSQGDYLFRCHEEAELQTAISLLMPVRMEEYRHRDLHPIFQMNLPEGYVLEQLRNRLAKTTKVDPMLLLALSGSSSPIGRVRVNSAEVDALLQRQEFPGERLEEILAWNGTEDIFAGLVDRYILRAGISGVQPKVVVPEWQETVPIRFTSKTSDLIIKSGRDEFPGLAINEFLCMSVAQEAGISVPEFYLSDNTQCSLCAVLTVMRLSIPLGLKIWRPLWGFRQNKSTPKVTRPLPKPFVCSVPLSKYSPHCISCLPS